VTFALAVLITPTVVMAQDGGQDDGEQIAGYVILGEEVAGPHIVQVQISPIAPKEGFLRVAVRVRDAETGVDIEDAIVRIFGSPSNQGRRQYSPGLNSPFDPIFYLAQLELAEAGIWAIDVEVETDLGSGSTVLSLEVGSRTRGVVGSAWGTGLFLIVLMGIGSGIFWLWYSSKKALARQRDQRTQGL